MINPNYVFVLKPDTTVETIGGNITAKRLSGRKYKESSHFITDEDGEETPTFLIEGNSSWRTVQQCDVEEIINLNELST